MFDFDEKEVLKAAVETELTKIYFDGEIPTRIQFGNEEQNRKLEAIHNHMKNIFKE